MKQDSGPLFEVGEFVICQGKQDAVVFVYPTGIPEYSDQRCRGCKRYFAPDYLLASDRDRFAHCECVVHKIPPETKTPEQVLAELKNPLVVPETRELETES